MVVVTENVHRSLHAVFQKKLSSQNPQRRIGFLTADELGAISADAVIVWLARSSPPQQVVGDSSRIVLVCVLGGTYAAFDSVLATYAQMGRGYSCSLMVGRLHDIATPRDCLERRLKILRRAGPNQSHQAAEAAAVVVHQWLIRFASTSNYSDRQPSPPSVTPTHPGRIKTLWDLSLRFVLAAWALVTHLGYGAFFAQRWRVGHLKFVSLEDVPARLGEVTWWPELGRGEFLADPFIESEEPPVLLCEWKRPEKGRGVIARVRFDEHRRSLEIAEILDGVYAHLSYPNFIEDEESKIIFPECAQSGGLTMYRLDDLGLPRQPGRLLFDQPLIDATLLRHDNLWWLFGTLPGASQSESHLYLYYSVDLSVDSWTPHRLNPVVIDPACARPAGKILVKDGRLIRPAQDCERRYGSAISFMEITALSTERYEESLLMRLSPSSSGFPKHGIHTFNIVGSTAILDGYNVRFDPLAWFDRLMERPTFRKALGKRSIKRS
ncbi:MAG: hypothetical protein ABI769_08340 [Pseudomonadota bacterium]